MVWAREYQYIGESNSEKELLVVTDVSTTWAEVIFRTLNLFRTTLTHQTCYPDYSRSFSRILFACSLARAKQQVICNWRAASYFVQTSQVSLAGLFGTVFAGRKIKTLIELNWLGESNSVMKVLYTFLTHKQTWRMNGEGTFITYQGKSLIPYLSCLLHRTSTWEFRFLRSHFNQRSFANASQATVLACILACKHWSRKNIAWHNKALFDVKGLAGLALTCQSTWCLMTEVRLCLRLTGSLLSGSLRLSLGVIAPAFHFHFTHYNVCAVTHSRRCQLFNKSQTHPIQTLTMYAMWLQELDVFQFVRECLLWILVKDVHTS